MNRFFLQKLQGFEPNHVAVDSRLVREGGMFVAIKGMHHDGHDYLEEVHRRGAIAAMVDESYEGDDYGLQLFRVDDTVAALQDIAAESVKDMECKVVAITGSVGKTTTKEFVQTLLSETFRVGASPGNANSQIGLPLAIINTFTGDEEILVLEMGMSVKGNLSRLVQMIPPDIAVITAVELVHACNFTGLEAIADAKAEILSHPRTKTAVINRDIIKFEEICAATSAKTISYASSSYADYSFACGSDHYHVYAEGGEHTLPCPPVVGGHNMKNLLAAIVVARQCGVPWEDIAKAIPKLTLPERRLQHQEKNGVLFVNDAYNACEVSIKAALDSLPKAAGKRIAVVGAMLELGVHSDRCHYEVGKYAMGCVDHLLCLGEECAPMVDLWKKEGRNASLHHERSALAEELQSLIQPNDVVLLKGSQAKELWKIIDEVNL
ncbi:MAG: UDP-N-acetylmuramoyl-tripeptide--D-alanyl-D-alanine ligase [Chlamydiales bacterium]|nr:UDP-N-acetylmuramoyl-tripeptide--D-alanyl-D-alanine ligase [Chlamydiia bacterium]MCP5507252.1 UDP-N-acetylmuramoyl-tripeptide--D-alanyl-D-alanine ligase [Chlamydiales bacterium]